LGAAPTLRGAAEIAKEPAYRAQRFAGSCCNSYLLVAEDIAGADDHRKRSNEFGLGGAETVAGNFTAFRIPATITRISVRAGVVAGGRRRKKNIQSQLGEPAVTKPELGTKRLCAHWG
jgi:hypothetical protein